MKISYKKQINLEKFIAKESICLALGDNNGGNLIVKMKKAVKLKQEE